MKSVNLFIVIFILIVGCLSIASIVISNKKRDNFEGKPCSRGQWRPNVESPCSPCTTCAPGDYIVPGPSRGHVRHCTHNKDTICMKKTVCKNGKCVPAEGGVDKEICEKICMPYS